MCVFVKGECTCGYYRMPNTADFRPNCGSIEPQTVHFNIKKKNSRLHFKHGINRL